MRPTYFVNNDAVIHVATQQRWNKPAGQPDWNGIAQAIKLSEPGDTIGFIGAHQGVNLGENYIWNPNAAYWANGALNGLRIFGLHQTESKIVGSINFVGMNHGAGEEPYRIEFSNYTHIVNNMRCIHTSMYAGPFMGLRFSNIKFDVRPENFPGSLQANDWIFRFHGRAQFHIENCEQLHPNQMHFVYADNVAGDSSVLNCKANGNGRTMVQIVNRQAQPVSNGNILVDRCLSIGAGHLDGASAFTCSGHLGGTVTIKNCHTKDALGGSLSAWGETGLHPCHVNAEGKAIDNLVIKDCTFHSTNSDRMCMAISNCNLASVGRISVTSNQEGLRLNHHQGQEVLAFRFTVPNPSQFVWNAPHKVVSGYNHATTRIYTDQEIDAMYQPVIED